jgi:hypothetical protein
MVPVLITDIFSHAGTYIPNEVVYGDIEIRMGVTTQPTPTTSWATNNPNPTTVYRGPLRIRWKTGQWTGIGLPNVYLWLPLSTSDNLCIEVIVWQVLDKGVYSQAQNFYYPVASATLARAYSVSWVQNGGHSNTIAPSVSASSGSKMGLLFNDGNMVDLGTGCKSSAHPALAIGSDAGKWPQSGVPFNVNLAGAAPTAPAFLMIGAGDQQWGALKLPLDLGIIGAPGCKVWNDVLISLATVTNASGAATYSLPLPTSIPLLRINATYGVLDAGANALGLATSSYLKILAW